MNFRLPIGNDGNKKRANGRDLIKAAKKSFTAFRNKN